MYDRVWSGASKGCWEIGGQTLGIMGYGHIDSWLSALAKMFGMRVIFYGITSIMPLGSACAVDSLCVLLEQQTLLHCTFPSRHRRWG